VDFFVSSYASSELMYTPAHCTCHLATLEHPWHASEGCVSIVSIVRILVYVTVLDTRVHPAMVDPPWVVWVDLRVVLSSQLFLCFVLFFFVVHQHCWQM
jgi:hypothetical protein